MADTPQVGSTARPTLTVDPFDGTTSASVAVYRPSGAVAATLGATSGDGGATWLATTNVVYDAAGWWIHTWTVTGTGADVKSLPVWVDPAAPPPAVSWLPTREKVAAYITTRTLARDDVTGTPVATFDETTIPTGDQVDRVIVDAASWVLTATGPLDVTVEIDPHSGTTLGDAAAGVVAVRAAGLVELAYPSGPNGVNVGNDLLRQADAALSKLEAANKNLTGSDEGATEPLPVWSFPDSNIDWDNPILYGSTPWGP